METLNKSARVAIACRTTPDKDKYAEFHEGSLEGALDE